MTKPEAPAPHQGPGKSPGRAQTAGDDSVRMNRVLGLTAEDLTAASEPCASRNICALSSNGGEPQNLSREVKVTNKMVELKDTLSMNGSRAGGGGDRERILATGPSRGIYPM